MKKISLVIIIILFLTGCNNSKIHFISKECIKYQPDNKSSKNIITSSQNKNVKFEAAHREYIF